MNSIRFFLSAFLFFAFGFIYAQDAYLTGKLIDIKTSEPLVGANIVADGKHGVTSDIDGNYKIKLSPGEHKINFSYLGYETVQQKMNFEAGERKQLDIQLKSKSEELRLIVVSGSQHAKNIAEETVSMNVISSDLIKNTNTRDLGEAVYKTPGVLVQDGQVIIRGGGSYSYGVGTRTAILVDGQSFMSADLGEGQMKFAPIENTEQVEIIKGSSSVIYGSSALNGVVNLITAWPVKGENKTEFDVYAGIYQIPNNDSLIWWNSGHPSVYGILFNHMQKKNNLGIVLGGNIDYINSYLEDGDEFRFRMNFKTKYTLPKNNRIHFGLNGNVMVERSGRFFLANGLESYEKFQGSNDHYVRTSIDPHFTFQNERGHRVNLNVRYLNVFRRGSGTVANASSNAFNLDSRYQFDWKNRVLVTAGIPFSFGISESNLYKGTRINYSGAIYVQAEFKNRKERLSLVGGVRYEIIGVDSIFESGLPVVRAGVNYKFRESTYVRASVGQSYRLPTVGERFITAEFFNPVFVVPNPDLLPEKGWSAEVGLKQGFRISKWKGIFDFTIFYQNYQDFVEYRLENFAVDSNGGLVTKDGELLYNNIIATPLDENIKLLGLVYALDPSFHLPPGGGGIIGLFPQNVERAQILGYEASIISEGNIGPVLLKTLVGYTYVWPYNMAADSTGKAGQVIKDAFHYMFQRVEKENESKVLQFRPRHIFRGDVEFTYKKISLGYSVFYNSFPESFPPLFEQVGGFLPDQDLSLDEFRAKHEKGDWAMDGRASYQITDKFKFSFIVKNLTNKIYSQRPAKLEAPRSFTFQLNFKL